MRVPVWASSRCIPILDSACCLERRSLELESKSLQHCEFWQSHIGTEERRKMRYLKTTLLLSTVALPLLSLMPAAEAADISQPQSSLWTGPYVGLSAGYVWGEADVKSEGEVLSDGLTPLEALNGHEGDENYGFKDLLFGQAVEKFSALSGSDDGSSFLWGANLGYNYQVSDLIVMGVDINIGKSDLSAGGSATNSAYVAYDYPGGDEGTDITGTTSVNAEIDWFSTFAGRLGFLATPDLMVYGMGGVAVGEVSVHADGSYVFSGHPTGDPEYCWNGDSSCDPQDPSNTGTFNSKSDSDPQWKVGYVVGGGLEYALNESWTIRGEAAYWNLGKTSSSSTLAVTGYYDGDEGSLVSSTKGSVTLDGYLARATIAFHF